MVLGQTVPDLDHLRQFDARNIAGRNCRNSSGVAACPSRRRKRSLGRLAAVLKSGTAITTVSATAEPCIKRLLDHPRIDVVAALADDDVLDEDGEVLEGED